MSYIPTKQDEARLRKTLRELKLRLAPLRAKLIDVGSTAKGTWLSDQSDIDMYVLTEDPQRAYELVKETFPQGHDKKGQLTIWNFQLNGFDIDLVLAIRGIKREDTMQHTAFFKKHLCKRQVYEVRKAKAYLRTRGVYGAEIGGIVGIAIEELIRQFKTFKEVCRVFTSTMIRPTIQDPTMTESRDLLACINPLRYKQLLEAFSDYINKPRFKYKSMTTQEFMAEHPKHCTLMFKRKFDKGLDYQTITSVAEKASRILRHTEREVSVNIDAYCDSSIVLLTHIIRPLELPSTKVVAVDPSLADVKAFSESHPDAYMENGMLCAVVKRKVVFPDSWFTNYVTQEMKVRGYELC